MSIEHKPSPPVPAVQRPIMVPVDAHARAALQVVDRLRGAGHAAYPVGGCVRDLVLGVAPKDWDVATAALPPQVRAVFGRVIEVGVAFGVLRVPMTSDGERFEIEVATFRADGPYGDGRRPDRVRFTDAREDVLRRDFTLNGLLLDPGPAETGDLRRSAQVVDWVGGLADLDARRLRAIGRPADRFAEDGLRLLRAVRFAARFDLQIEAITRRSISHLAAGLKVISAERICAELAGALQLPWAPRAAQLLGELDLYAVLWPALSEVDPGLLRAARRMAVVCAELMQGPPEGTVEGCFRPPQPTLDLPLALAILLADIAPLAYRDMLAVGRELRLSLVEGRRLALIWQLQRALAALLSARTPSPAAPLAPALIRTLRHDEGDAALLLQLAAAGDVSEAAATVRALRRLRATADQPTWQPKPWIDGATLKALGHVPSAAFKEALLAAEDAQLAGADQRTALAAALACL